MRYSAFLTQFVNEMSNSSFATFLPNKRILVCPTKRIGESNAENMTKAIKKKSEDMGSRPMFEWYMWINNMHDLVNILTDYGLYPMGKCFILSLTIFVYSYTSTLLNISHTICK